jgi:hypothetical protein
MVLKAVKRAGGVSGPLKLHKVEHVFNELSGAVFIKQLLRFYLFFTISVKP